MNISEEESMKGNESNVPKDVNDSDESLEHKEQGLPPVDAENFDDAGDLEGLQLGLATAPKNKFLDEEKELPSDEDRVEEGK